MLNLIKRRKERNIDRIRKMSVEELADAFNTMTTYCPEHKNNKIYCCKVDCKPCIVKWLQAEAEGEQK